jgi:putative ABC transport system permease protein
VDLRLWLRWSLRDLRARWLQVVAIALVIALGAGSYSGLTSVTRWRRISTDDGYQALRMYDLRVSLAENATVPQGMLVGAARAIPDAGRIDAASERLITDTQVDASTPEQAVLVPGAVYGLDLSGGEPAVNALYAAEGRPLDAADAGAPVAVLERHFAKHYDLPASGTVRLSGGRALEYVGQAMTPEFFVVTTEQGALLAEANFAAVFTSLQTAQEIAGRPGAVNDLVLTLHAGADRAAVQRELQDAIAARLPGIAAEVTTRDDDPSFRLNDRDIEGDQQIYDIFAVLIFAGAVGAAFNLTARLVEAQRREIGIAMTLGVPRWRIALRPMLVGAEIALLGVLFGIATGYALGQLMMVFVRDLQPLPAWHTPFQAGLFAAVAAIGFALPLIATAWPVWSAVRVPPIVAMQPAYRLARGGGLAPALRRLRLPGGTFLQMPVRNLVRAPRRALLTSVGIGAALAALVAFVGMIDSFVGTTDAGQREISGKSPDRLEVQLTGFLRADGPEVQAIARSPAVAATEPDLLVGGEIVGGKTDIELQLQFLNMDGAIWQPSLIEGRRDRAAPGIYLSELAAKDLGVGPGATVTLRHPRVDPGGGVTETETPLEVLGVHPHPFRFIAYIDINHADLLGPTGYTNFVQVQPAPGVSPSEVKRALFGLPGVSSIQRDADVATAFHDLLNQFVVILRVVEGAMLLIAALIAFNASSINTDERAREHATMFAFGVPVRRVVLMTMLENLVLGIAATAGGLLGGWFLLRLTLATRVKETLPDILIKPTISGETLAITVVLGVLVVALAPLAIVRRLQRMDVPSALKVME